MVGDSAPSTADNTLQIDVVLTAGEFWYECCRCGVLTTKKGNVLRLSISFRNFLRMDPLAAATYALTMLLSEGLRLRWGTRVNELTLLGTFISEVHHIDPHPLLVLVPCNNNAENRTFHARPHTCKCKYYTCPDVQRRTIRITLLFFVRVIRAV